jgi:hypothetical protein
MVSHSPLRVPNVVSDDKAYSEQEGVNRQGEGRPSTANW